MTIEPGAIVWLKSGGPAMTVKEIKRTDIVCNWFDKSMKIQLSVFGAHELTDVDPWYKEPAAEEDDED